MPLVEPGIHADFAHLDQRGSDVALACLDLQQRAPLLMEVRRHILDLLAPRAGQVLLDVGCGAGHDVFELARLVGGEGGVIGVDKSEAMIAEASRRATEAVVGNVEFRVGDAERLPLDDNAIDGARSDRVFQYVSDAQVAVGELVRVTRPGGRVVVADTDWGVSMFDCDDSDLSVRVEEAWTATRPQGRIGRRLYSLFVRGGLQDVQVFPHVAVTNLLLGDVDAAQVDLFHRELVASFAAQAVEAGAVTAEEAGRWMALQHAAQADGRFFRFLTMFVAVGCMPDDSLG